jgi:hypothetical protein
MLQNLSAGTRKWVVLAITALAIIAILIGAKLGETRKTIITPDMIAQLQEHNPDANGGK